MKTNQLKRDLSPARLQSLKSDKYMDMTSSYTESRTLSNRILEVIGAAIVLVGPYAAAVLIGGH